MPAFVPRSTMRPVGRRSAVDKSRRQRIELEQLAACLDHASLMIAVVGSIANALSIGAPCAPGMAGLTCYRPTTADLMPDTLSRLSTAVDFELVRALRSLSTQLMLAAEISSALGRLDNGEQAAIDAAADGWRRSASIANVARLMLARDRDDESGSGDARGKGIGRLLQSVCRGEAPCLDEDGNVTVPGWAERRSGGTRHRMNLEAQVLARGVWSSALIVDASASGLGLQAIGRLEPGDAVVVAIDDSTFFEGVVIWARQQRAGIAVADGVNVEHLRSFSQVT